jgi:ADP-ribose pyrophosphatase YjhB (NUDIX family)
MGLITGLLTLPLAPVRGLMWIGEQLEAEAARELDEPARLRRELAALQAALERGEIDEQEFERREDELLDALEAS